MLFAIENARALYYRAISEAQVGPPPEAVQRARAAHVTIQRAVVTVTQEAIRVCGGRAFLQALSARALCARRARRSADAPVDPGDRDATGLGSRARPGRAAERYRKGVTMMGGDVLDTLARPSAPPTRRMLSIAGGSPSVPSSAQAADRKGEERMSGNSETTRRSRRAHQPAGRATTIRRQFP